MEKRMNELSEREMYEVEGGAMVSELDKGLGDGGGTIPVDITNVSDTRWGHIK